MAKSSRRSSLTAAALIAGIGSCVGDVNQEQMAPAEPVAAAAIGSFDPKDPVASGMVLTFDEEFTTASISSDHVAHGTRWTNRGINPGGIGIEMPVPEALSVRDGVLDITATNSNGNWTSGFISTVNASVQGFTQKYGYFEARIKIPVGNGAWPSFWLISADHFTRGGPASELDVVEAGSAPREWTGTIHDGYGHQNRDVVQRTDADLSQGYHTFGLLWPPNSPYVTWYLDGKATHGARKYRDTDSAPMLLIVQLAIAKPNGRPDASAPRQLHMYVDYVRVWQFADQKPVAVAMQPVSPAGSGGK